MFVAFNVLAALATEGLGVSGLVLTREIHMWR